MKKKYNDSVCVVNCVVIVLEIIKIVFIGVFGFGKSLMIDIFLGGNGDNF